MASAKVTWDPTKAAANVRKHAVSFEEVESVFYDEVALLEDDPDESYGEERFVMVGMSSVLRVLVVCHCVREQVLCHPSHLYSQGGQGRARCILG